jgi:hypothetical protein
MRAFLSYLAASAVALVVVAAVLAGWVMPTAGSAIWFAAGLAYLVQAIAFAALTLTGVSGMAWIAAWGGGTLLRLLAVLGTALWAARSEQVPTAPVLLSLAGFLFLLLLLEPVFFRTGMRSR